MTRTSLEERLQIVRAYHRRTMHHYHAYARSLGYLDWESQPDPFRRYEGTEKTFLPLGGANEPSPPYDSLFGNASIESSPVTAGSLGRFLQFSLGLSAWKEFQGSRWALRMNPSSGNLHPTEGYLILPTQATDSSRGLPGEGGGVFHYVSEDHSLELRTRFDSEVGAELLAGFPPGTFLVGLSSIHWREAWKYGERAYRYCQHDVGHTLAALAVSARALGWSLVQLEDLSDAEVGALLGTDRIEEAHPMEGEAGDLIAAISPRPFDGEPPTGLPTETIERIRGGVWFGQPNRLSAEHHRWEIIDEVHSACEKPETASKRPPLPFPPEDAAASPAREVEARETISKRRSAVSMDAKTGMDRETFFRILDRTLPRSGNPVFEGISWPPAVHLCLFVHPLLEGIDPGVYWLARHPGKVENFRAAFRKDFLWRRPEGCPETLPLFQLLEGDCRRVAESVSCGQAIAGDGVFSLGMLAEFDETLDTFGPWNYRRLFWETGAIGQILYLEAVAAGVSATGIGCFFDDPVHQILGLTDTRLQSLYHFTMGGAVEDRRLTTHPPYGAERMAKGVGE